MAESNPGAGERAEPGRILRALQETARAELPELGGGAAPTNPLERELGGTNRPPAAGAADGAPTLDVERDGDRVRRITATCSCGRKIDIHCDYDASDPGEDPAAAIRPNEGGAP